MGKRGEIFSTRIFADGGNKTYFLNVKENRYKDIYLNIVESRKTGAGFQRFSIIVFQEDLDGFLIALDRITKAIREHKSDPPSLRAGEGRREYKFALTKRGKPALQITEECKVEGNSRYEKIYVELSVLDMFMKELGRTAPYLTSAGST
ncbi:MAG: hypothetical protein B6D68_01710 [spirochete symbiont of Stewartia floridana]|nr:MAG: hypothetical protein B6D68_01710 [spirochete symbiont of Stewartia floridana]